MSDEKIFAEGLVVKRNERAPDFVICNLSVKVGEFVNFLHQHESEGWVNIQCKVSKNGKLYAELDTWRPNQGEAARAGIDHARQQVSGSDIVEDDIPF